MGSRTFCRVFGTCVLIASCAVAASYQTHLPWQHALRMGSSPSSTASLGLETRQPNATPTPTPTPKPTPTPLPTPAPNPDLDTLNQRIRDDTGINVELPKVYDDSLLQQMLNDAEARLAAISTLDQSKLLGSLGAVSGASLDTSSFGFSLLGPPSPGVTTAANGATGSTVTTNTSTTSASPSTVNTVVTNSGLPTQNVTTTVPQFSAPTATAPTPSASLPSSAAVSSSNILMEQMQLTYEIANLRLLLEGAISDRFLKYQNSLIVNPRVTIGFPIALSPDIRKHKDAVAVLEVEITNLNTPEELPLPSITALLPREKTYNVAAIRDKSISIGGGIATQVVGVAGSFLRGHKTYYVVQDQDTLAVTYQPTDKNRIGVQWQFRPVLGQHYVRSEKKQTVLQLAFPVPWDAPLGFGIVHVRTYWRKYDSKTGLLKEVIPGSLAKYETYAWRIPKYPLEQAPGDFSARNMEDLGGGLMRVSLLGHFLSDTQVRVGSTLLRPGSPGWASTYSGIRFVAPINDLATKAVALVPRDGNEIPLAIGTTEKAKFDTADQTAVPFRCSSADYGPESPILLPPENNPPRITDIIVSTVDQTNTQVQVQLKLPEVDLGGGNKRPGTVDNVEAPLIMVIGGRAFGYSDAPIIRRENTLTAVVPTALITANPVVIVKHLFAPRGYSACRRIVGLDPFSQPERMVLLEQGKDANGQAFLKFLLYGSRLKNITIISPDPTTATVDPAWYPEYADSLRLIMLKMGSVKAGSQLVFQRSDEKGANVERPLIVPIPVVEAAPAKGVIAKERVTLNADQVLVSGEGLDKVTRVTFQGTELPKLTTFDGWKTAVVTGLRAAHASTTATTQVLKFWFPDKEIDVTIEVVSSKVETTVK